MPKPSYTTTVDSELEASQKAITSLSASLSFKWISADVLGHAVLTSLLSCSVFVLCSVHLTTDPLVTGLPHMMMGVVLGLLLVCRVIIGVNRAAEVVTLICTFNKHLRTIAVFSTYVNETLTVAAGAELEKKAVANFRYELDRLLNLSNFCFTLMLKGLKVEDPPETLRAIEGGKMEMKVLQSVGSPTLMVCKWIANLLDQQHGASRVSGEQVAMIQGEISALMDTYHKTRALQFAPMPASLSSFTYFFVVLWTYTACPIIAVAELHSPDQFYTAGIVITVFMSFLVSLFFFGLYEAGKLMESPVKTTTDLIPVDALSYALSDDITNLTDDPDQAVPVFLAPALQSVADVAVSSKVAVSFAAKMKGRTA